MEAKIDKLQNRLAAIKVDKDEEVKQKGHGKYLDCQFLTDTSYHDDSVVPFQTPVSSVVAECMCLSLCVYTNLLRVM